LRGAAFGAEQVPQRDCADAAGAMTQEVAAAVNGPKVIAGHLITPE
jgi:hypothetical protein